MNNPNNDAVIIDRDEDIKLIKSKGWCPKCKKDHVLNMDMGSIRTDFGDDNHMSKGTEWLYGRCTDKDCKFKIKIVKTLYDKA